MTREDRHARDIPVSGALAAQDCGFPATAAPPPLPEVDIRSARPRLHVGDAKRRGRKDYWGSKPNYRHYTYCSAEMRSGHCAHPSTAWFSISDAILSTMARASGPQCSSRAARRGAPGATTLRASVSRPRSCTGLRAARRAGHVQPLALRALSRWGHSGPF